MGLLRIALLGMATFIGWRLYKTLVDKRSIPPGKSNGNSNTAQLQFCEQCGVYVDAKSTLDACYEGKPVFFCGTKCEKIYADAN